MGEATTEPIEQATEAVIPLDQRTTSHGEGRAGDTARRQPARPRFVLEPERLTLPNGLEVVLDPMPGTESVAISVTYRVGARHQPPGYTGLAHLTEHMMFEGSLHAPGHFLDQLDAMGATDRNGTTSRDRTTYYEVVPSEQLERALFLEADRMAFLLPAMREELLASQRRVVLRERAERVDLGGLGIVPGLMARVLYPRSHPYADLHEHTADVEAHSLSDVAWLVQRWYAPDNATLAISGGFDPAQARALVERFFAPIVRSGPRPEPEVLPRTVQLADERRVVIEAPVSRDELLVVWPTPAWGEEDDAALDIVAHELTARLERLVSGGHARGVLARQYSYEVASELMVSVVVGRRQGTLEALAAIDRELLDIEVHGIAPARVAQIATDLIDEDIESLEAPVQRATQLARRSAHAPDGRWSLAWDIERWRAVTPERAREALRRWLPRDRRLVLSITANRDAPYEGRVVVDMTMPRPVSQ